MIEAPQRAPFFYKLHSVEARRASTENPSSVMAADSCDAIRNQLRASNKNFIAAVARRATEP